MKLTNEELDALLAKAGLRLDQEYSPRSARRSAVRATGANGIAARRISITRTA
mgnify:CR=1 FL=1